ncbi:MAG: 6-bladed beta-propeller [Candidatus Aminicenantes bacterium]|nr:6-bladed beta-propeller [Candidatus Aminicenantes bacterium]
MKRLACFALVSIVVISLCCSKEKWHGSIYKEQGVTVIDSEGSGIWGAKINEKITFKENLALGVEEGEEFLMFHSELDVAVDFELNIYVLDVRNHRLLKFDKNGNFIWKAGRKGQGPGEFRNPSEVAVSPAGEIWVLDLPTLIHLFDAQGKYQQTMNLMGRCTNFYFLPDGRLFINRTTRGQMGFAADYYSVEGEFLEKFPDEYRFGPNLPNWAGGSIGGGGYHFLDGKIYMVLPEKYEIREYDLDGNLLEKIKRDYILKPPVLKKFQTGYIMRALNVIGPCFLYKKKMLLNMLMLVEEKAEQEVEVKFYLDFFNEKGRFLGSYKLPEETALNTIDHEDNFYFVQQLPFPRIVRSTLELR